MEIRTKINRGYRPINKSLTPSIFEKCGSPMKFLLGLFAVLLVIYIFLRIYINLKRKALIFNNEENLIINKNLEPNEIIYQNNSQSEIDEKELKDIKNFINNDKLLNPDEIFKKYENPKISIIIPIYNGEQFIEKSLLSIYNQNFKEIEVIIIDDFSTDKTQEKINQLKEKYPSISYYRNEKNKGLLNSKIIGILNSKGKYILFLNPNDFFAKNDVFNQLYDEAEKNNLDILGFASLLDEGKYIHHFCEINLINQPNIKNIMYSMTKDSINRAGDVLFNYFIKAEFLIQNVKQIDEKYLNQTVINYNSDFFLLYLISKNATNFKQIKNIFYYSSKNWNKTWEENELNIRCSNYLSYIDFLFNKTNDDWDDKKIVMYELENWILNTKCRKYDLTRDEAVNLSKKITEKNYVPNHKKLELFLFIFENITTISTL